MRQGILYIGLDDTDSRKGMCTTFLAYKIVDYLKKEKAKFLDYPNLIRFNPNIPWKTRGNGAVSIKIQTHKVPQIKKNIIRLVRKYSSVDDGANPGLVFYENSEISKDFVEFARDALFMLVSRKRIKDFLESNKIESFYIGNGQGLVGAVGAIGYRFRDHTFELISYRKRSNFGKKRQIMKKSVKRMQEITYPQTFNSYDSSKNRVLIAPHGPDPVLFGIRGEDVKSIIRAASLVKFDEALAGYLIFRSNQGTGDHLQNKLDHENLRPFYSGYVTGIVLEKPKTMLGGHVLFTILCEGREIRCAVYKPTKLGNVALHLHKGDLVKVGGGVRKASKNHERVLNVEFLEILKLEKNIVLANPLCVRCKKRTKSKGKGQGFHCVKCGKIFRDKVSEEIHRKIEQKLYFPAISAHRHLTRPAQRAGRFNTKLKFDGSKRWFCNLD